MHMTLSGTPTRETATRIEAALVERWRTWFVGSALPFWRTQGFDPERGLFFEQLNLNGTPRRDAALRIRTQARQIYTFAHASELGLDPTGNAFVLPTLVRLRELAANGDLSKGWAHKLHPDGSVADPLRDLYDHAFVLLMLSHVWRVGSANFVEPWIERTLAAIDGLFAAGYGGFAEDDKHTLPRRQNPHMHLFEALLSLMESSRDPRFATRAGEIFGLFRTRFFDDDQGVLREFFAIDWQHLEDGQSDAVEPGHFMEWVWLLRRYERLAGRPVDDLCAALFARGEALGLVPEANGFLVDVTDIGGSVGADSRRLWTQTEYLKALVVQARVTREVDLWHRAQLLSDQIFETYLSPGSGAPIPEGTWRDRFTVDGALVVDHIPASSLYHLFGVLVELELTA